MRTFLAFLLLFVAVYGYVLPENYESKPIWPVRLRPGFPWLAPKSADFDDYQSRMHKKQFWGDPKLGDEIFPWGMGK
ncbi:unnamed protein product [Caenorhabditis auriculariae]|uniref:Uncharacterized protein n=1 Tax=Caenorhabditis auriculariae TaxID=2777116 RepID=A0A8S1H554_9PELO|nr:unnamed protein product [Caenorhabditis auriculariae]